MFRKSLFLGLIPLLFAVTAVASPDTEDLKNPTVVSLERTGGFAGGRLQADLYFKKSEIVIRRSSEPAPVSISLTSDQIKPVKDLLAVIPFENLEKTYRCEACRDAFHYELFVKDGSDELAVSWDDSSQAPKELFDLGRALTRLTNP